jgi:hypothetical protein
LISIGWENYVLQCEFKGGRRYQFGGVDKEVHDKILRNPFPDSMFQKLVRGKYVSKRIDTPPVAKPMPEVDMSDLPF